MTATVVGTWRLRQWETHTADGQVSYPLGSDALGYLTYTADGYLFVAMMRADRPRYTTSDLLGGTPTDKAEAASSYVTYCGRYHVEGGRVLHHIELSLYPNWTGVDQERFVVIEGDQLIITTAPIAIGGTTTNRLVWERVHTPAQ
ncbi:MAG TPA: lipocalin-like domain-containing protein [Chloroflexota bacterium]|nr:lipocalin-like domain-containing protein [Chloroflexota bacterium]